MHFIEQIFGISPDGGNGSQELLWVLAVTASIMIVGVWRSRARGHNEPRKRE